MTDQALEAIPFPQLLEAMSWEQGEHVSLIGTTGLGKTTLALQLVRLRQYVVAFGTKPADTTLEKLTRRSEGPNKFRRVKRWGERRPRDHRVLLWPPMRGVRDRQAQADQFTEAFDDCFAQGGWCLFADEAAYMTGPMLGMKDRFQLVWQQGRAVGCSLLVCIQRPAWVPLEAYNAATHLFFWRESDEANLRRIGGIGYHDAATIRHTVANLRNHDVLYVNTRTGAKFVTRPPAP